MHYMEFGTLQWLSYYISPHLISGAVLKINFASVVKMANKEIFSLDVCVALRAGDIAIFG